MASIPERTRMLARISIAGPILVLLTACAGLNSKTPEEIVADRAQAQVAALMAGDYDEALKYTTPGFQGSEQSRLYRANHSNTAGWRSAELLWVKCDDEPEPTSCQVRFLIEPTFSMAYPGAGLSGSVKGMKIPWEKQWIKVSGDWYQYQGMQGIRTLRGQRNPA